LTVLAAAVAAGCSSHARHEGARDLTIESEKQAITVRLPPGWSGRITSRQFAYPDAAVVYLANFRLPNGDDEAATRAQRRLGRDNVLIIATEGPRIAGFPVQPRTIAVDTRGVPIGGHAVVDQFFVVSGRGFLLHAVFGAKRPPAKLIRRVNAVLATLRAERRTQPLRPAPDPAPASALKPARLLPTPARVLTQCRLAQARSHQPILCPTRLPQPFLGWPRPHHLPLVTAHSLPAPGVDWRSRSDPRYRKHEVDGLTIGYGAPWEPDSGPDWRLHLWRNRPCCFLHFEIFRRATGARNIPAGARPATLGGHHGLLKDATSWGLAAPNNDYLYFPNHTRFLWRENGVDYVATLHRLGSRAETRRLLGRLIRELRPVSTR
jgi:hypothetical protein